MADTWPGEALPIPATDLTSKVVGKNVGRIRAELGISAQAVSDRLAQLGVKLARSGVADIERGVRTVSVDQLTAFARVLEVSPVALLMPWMVDGDYSSAALTGVGADTGRELWAWLTLRAELHEPPAPEGDPVAALDHRVWVRRNTPPWAWTT